MADIGNLIDAEMQQGPALASNASATPPAPDPIGAGIEQEINEQKYGTPGQIALTGIEGGLKGALGPVATAGEAIFSKAGVPGLSPQEQAARAETNPGTSMASELGGFAAPAIASAGLSAAARAGLEIPEAVTAAAKLFSENTQAGLLEKAGKAVEPVAAALGVGGPGSGVLGKIGSSAVRGAVENGLFQTGDQVSKIINGDPNAGVQVALPAVGGQALIGGILGGGAGAISTLWRATAGAKTGELLDSLARRVGGIEGVGPNPVQDMASKLGFEPAPEVMSAATNDPALRDMASILSQSDTSNAGRSFQETMAQGRQKAGEVLSQTLGIEPGQIPSEFDEYSHGQKILNTLADEAEERLAPIKAGYDEAKARFAGKDLEPSVAAKSELENPAQKALRKSNQTLTEATKEALIAQKSGDPGAAIEAAAKVQDAQARVEAASRAVNNPGTVDLLQKKVSDIASDMKLGLAPDSAASKAVASIQRDLANPEFKTLSDLSAYIKKIPEKLPFNPNDMEGYEVSKRLRNAFRETEGEVLGSHIGSEEGQDALDYYRATQKRFAEEASIKEELESKGLGDLGPTSSYDSRIREMANEKGEKGFRVLSGKNNADTLRLLQEHFPKTSEAVSQAIREKVLVGAKDGEKISPKKIIQKLEQLTPQQRGKIIPSQMAEDRITAIHNFIDQLEDRTHNWSNSGRTTAKLMQNLPGAAVGLVAMLLGHNPAVGLVIGGLTKYLGKDAPDAVRLGLLKWMGSNKPIESGAFKAMVDFIHSTSKGNTLMDHASKAIFSGTSKIIPEHLIPSDSEKDNLDKKIKGMTGNPYAIDNVAPALNHYMPNHAIAMGSAASNVVNYMNSITPKPTKLSPLDSEIEPSEEAKQNYERALEFAEQPMMLLHHMTNGTLTSEDVAHVKAMYPQFYQALNQKITNAMVDHTSKGNEIPYDTKQGLSVLMGQPMDSSLSTQNIMSNQAAFAPSNAQQQAGVSTTPKKSSVALRSLKHSDRITLDHSGNENA